MPVPPLSPSLCVERTRDVALPATVTNPGPLYSPAQRCCSRSEASPQSGQGGSRRSLSPSGPRGRRSSSCRHQDPLTAVERHSCPSQLWLATPSGSMKQSGSRYVAQAPPGKATEAPLSATLKVTPRLPPDARRRHKPPSKGAILEPKWLLSLSLSDLGTGQCPQPTPYIDGDSGSEERV